MWKAFKRSVWRFPKRPFLGSRVKINAEINVEYGDYKWMTFEEADYQIEYLFRAIKKRNFCPIIKSNVEGTPNMKLMGIFS